MESENRSDDDEDGLPGPTPPDSAPTRGHGAPRPRPTGRDEVRSAVLREA
ncbi:TetR/AcrR family transcriptional regulator, partial [Dietzia cercidiphylli]|nr:TetR/AcrR family transcriptional regulator [Dietzia cercidiphylli]